MFLLTTFINATEGKPPTTPHSLAPRSPGEQVTNGDHLKIDGQSSSAEDYYIAGYNLRWKKHQPAQAFIEFKQSADMGYSPAIKEVAAMLLSGIGTQQDVGLSITYYEKLPEDPEAMNSLGSIYEHYDLDGTDELSRLQQAKKYYEKAMQGRSLLGQENFTRISDLVE